MQMVFQHPASSLNPAHSVAETVGRPLRRFRGFRRGRELQAAVQRILGLVSLGADYLARYPHQLSGGEKQRIAVARAIAGEPDVVVCDEPVSALDVSVQATVLALLRRLQGDHGYAYLFISHDLAVVRHLAHRVAVMYRGRIVEEAGPRRCSRPPSTPTPRPSSRRSRCPTRAGAGPRSDWTSPVTTRPRPRAAPSPTAVPAGWGRCATTPSPPSEEPAATSSAATSRPPSSASSRPRVRHSPRLQRPPPTPGLTPRGPGAGPGNGVSGSRSFTAPGSWGVVPGTGPRPPRR